MASRLQKFLTFASRPAVESAVQAMFIRVQAGEWLTHTNRYGDNASAKIRREAQAGAAHHAPDLLQYVAASIPLHCFDGWKYFSAATCRLTHGDWRNALHLAYYAELRAAMSLLAAIGVGTFNKYHISLGQHGMRRQEQTTHEFVWAALQKWGESAKDSFPMGEIRIPFGATPSRLSDWLTNIPGIGAGPATAAVFVAGLLKAWSVDLKMLSGDREARNNVSYPIVPLAQSPVEITAFSRAILLCGRACEPAGTGSFQRLDRHLLRLALKAIYQATVTDQTATPFANFAQQILLIYRPAGDPLFHTELTFLTGDPDPTIDPLFLYALRPSDPRRPLGVLPVMARAFLLLRVASAGCAYHLGRVGVSETDVGFWWEAEGEDLGLWKTGEPPDSLEDLWADMRTAIDELAPALDTLSPPCTAELWHTDDRRLHLRALAQFQRAGLWSMGLS